MKELMSNPNLVAKPGIDLHLNYGNPHAIERCVRFTQRDMNRCFSAGDLASPAGDCYEQSRAQEVYHALGGKKGVMDLIVDFHATVANMGMTFIVSRTNPFICRMVAWLYEKHQHEGAHILYTAEDQETSPFLDSLGKCGLTIEVSPVGKGVLPAQEQYDQLRAVASEIMTFVNCWNDGIYKPEQVVEVPVYRLVQTIKYETDSTGTIRVSDVHPDILGKDFQPMKAGDPMMVDLRTGAVTAYEGDRVVWPVFICETASTYRDPRFGNQAMDLTWLNNEKW